MKNCINNLLHQTPLKILSFLSQHPNKTFCESEIRKLTKSSIGSINQTLRILLNLNIVTRETKGNLHLYNLNNRNPAIKHYKIFEILIYIHSLIKETQPYASEIILYGSCTEGLNSANSDIDIFIKTEHVSKIKKIVNKYRSTDDRFKVVVLDPLEILSSKKTDEVFYNEVKKGIILWKGKPEHEKI